MEVPLFGDESRWITAEGYPDSLALSIIDSIYSTGSKYQAVINVVNEYRVYRKAQGGDADRDGTSELIQTFKEAGGSAGWAERACDDARGVDTGSGSRNFAGVGCRACDRGPMRELFRA